MRYGDAARARAHARPARRGAAPRGPLALAGRARDRGRARRAWCPSCSARSPRSATRSSRSTARRGSSCSPSSSPTRTCPPAARTRARPRSWRAPLVAESHGTHELRAVLVHRTRESGLRMAAGMDHVVEAPEGTVTESESRRPRAGDGERRARPRRDADADQVPGLRLVEPALDAVDARPGRRRARVGAAHRLGRPARRPARVPRRLLGARRRRDRRRRRAPAGGALRALPHAAGRRARREARDPGQGPDGRRLRRARLLGHRDLRPAGADLHRARGRRATRCAGATRRSTSPRARARSCASTAPRSRGGRSAARSARPTGRPARPRSTSTPTSPTPCCATCTRPATTTSSAGPGSSCWSRPRGCGARSATTTRAARSTSTASPGPTSTRRSPTTTSTRT